MIEIRHLRYFIAIAEELSFRRAADRVHIDQTPLSRAARDLEEELGVQLLIRGHRRLQLTPAGQKLLSEARSLTLRLERVKRTVRMTHALYKSPLRIGIADDIAQPNLFECLRHWRCTVPDVPLELAEMRSSELAAALSREEVDIGFSFGLPPCDSLSQIPLWSCPMVAAIPSAHELAGVEHLSMPDLLAFPLVCWCSKLVPGLASQIQGVIGNNSQSANVVGEATTVFGFFASIASGAGVGLIDGGRTQLLRFSNVHIRPLATEECVTTFALVKKGKTPIPPFVQSFLTRIRGLF